MAAMKVGDVVAFGIMILVALAPLLAATVIAYRSRRRGWWLATPWMLLTGLTGLGLQMIHSGGLLERPHDLSITVLATGLTAAWLSLTMFLVALTLAGPNPQPPGTIRDK